MVCPFFAHLFRGAHLTEIPRWMWNSIINIDHSDLFPSICVGASVGAVYHVVNPIITRPKKHHSCGIYVYHPQSWQVVGHQFPMLGPWWDSLVGCMVSGSPSISLHFLGQSQLSFPGLSTYLPTCLPAYLPTCLRTYLPTYLPASIYLSTYLPIDLSFHLFPFLSIYLPTYLSIYPTTQI